MPDYTFPAALDYTRAEELATLVNAAYDQLAKFQAGVDWNVPDGYTRVATLTAKEIWKAPPPLSGLLTDLLKPVPFGFVATTATAVYVVIRGTSTPLEWFDDFSASPVPFQPSGAAWGNTTRGFFTLYSDPGMWPTINTALAALPAAALGNIFVTGHSLGAALAHLVTAGIKAQFPATNPAAYTFCSPRAGDPGFATAYDAAIATTCASSTPKTSCRRCRRRRSNSRHPTPESTACRSSAGNSSSSSS